MGETRQVRDGQKVDKRAMSSAKIDAVEDQTTVARAKRRSHRDRARDVGPD